MNYYKRQSRINKAILFTVLAALTAVISFSAKGYYEHLQEHGQYYRLFEKASTLSEKQRYLDYYISSWECTYEGQHNALFYKTEDNSFDENIVVFKALYQRLTEIQVMDIESVEYQLALRFISTANTGCAASTLYGIWWKNNYILLWSYFGAIALIISIASLFIAIIRMLHQY